MMTNGIGNGGSSKDIDRPDSKPRMSADSKGQGDTIEVIPDEYQGLPDAIKTRLDGVADFNFASIGYTPQEELKNLEYRLTYEEMVREGKDLEGLQKKLEERGVHIVRGASELLTKMRDPFGLGKTVADMGTRMNAGFISKESIAEEMVDARHSEAIRAELSKLSAAPVGAILMDDNPNPKSVYHEAGHAVQQMLGFEMNTKDRTQRIRREIETNSALINMRRAGLMPEVTCNKIIPKLRPDGTNIPGPFGPLFQISPNDVLSEESYFNSNLARL